MAGKDYDPLKVAIHIAGQPVEGFADGTFITVTRNAQTWTNQTGAGGESARSKSNDKSGTVEITLMQTSATNDLLSGLFLADENVSGSGKFGFTLSDENGTTNITSTDMWVQQPPSVEFGKELSDRVWTLETGNLIYAAVGGSEEVFPLPENL